MSLKQYAERSQTKKTVISVRFHLYKVLQKTNLTYNNRKQMSGCLGMGWRELSEMGRRGDGNTLFLNHGGS